MNKTLKQLVERACTGVFFWLVFTVYTAFVGVEVDHLETLVFFEAMTIISPIFISYVAKYLK
mgnify:FL=1|tara:strand:- start:47 stop:232 length:186 start_codon:yes stop_codon:yes gene_type:complete